MKIIVGADHAGYGFKAAVAAQLKEEGHEVVDAGTTSRDSVDYPDYGIRVAQAVASGEARYGILVCGTGIGMSIVANKFPGVRAALCHDPETAAVSRRHNDANVLVLGERALADEKKALEIVKSWLSTPFDGGRHQARLDKIAELERRLGKP